MFLTLPLVHIPYIGGKKKKKKWKMLVYYCTFDLVSVEFLFVLEAKLFIQPG